MKLHVDTLVITQYNYYESKLKMTDTLDCFFSQFHLTDGDISRRRASKH